MKNLRKLTVSRIAELKQLAEGVYQSQVNHVECVSDRGSLVTDLQIEALEMSEIFSLLFEFSMVCPTFFDTFDEVYYSCRIGMRKPDKEIFKFVLKQNGLKPEETVFIDDSIQHVKAAGECGISAFLLNKGEEIGDFLMELHLF